MSKLLSGGPRLAGPTETVPERGLQQKATEFVEELGGVFSVLGPKETARYYRNRMKHGPDYPVTLKPAGLSRPIGITTALCDILNIKEILNDGAYDLGDMKPNVDGLPIIDVGAFIGVSASSFASRFPNSEVLAIEPLSRNYELLRKNASAYGGQIVASQAAVLEEAGSASVVEHSRRHPYMPLYAPGEAGASVVPVVSPSQLMEMHGFGDEIGILKVDIEGGERQLFASGAISPILDRTHILMIETHDQFIPGCTDAVDQAAGRSGMELFAENEHFIRVYAQS